MKERVVALLGLILAIAVIIPEVVWRLPPAWLLLQAIIGNNVKVFVGSGPGDEGIRVAVVGIPPGLVSAATSELCLTENEKGEESCIKAILLSHDGEVMASLLRLGKGNSGPQSLNGAILRIRIAGEIVAFRWLTRSPSGIVSLDLSRKRQWGDLPQWLISAVLTVFGAWFGIYMASYSEKKKGHRNVADELIKVVRAIEERLSPGQEPSADRKFVESLLSGVSAQAYSGRYDMVVALRDLAMSKADNDISPKEFSDRIKVILTALSHDAVQI